MAGSPPPWGTKGLERLFVSGCLSLTCGLRVAASPALRWGRGGGALEGRRDGTETPGLCRPPPACPPPARPRTKRLRVNSPVLVHPFVHSFVHPFKIACISRNIAEIFATPAKKKKRITASLRQGRLPPCRHQGGDLLQYSGRSPPSRWPQRHRAAAPVLGGVIGPDLRFRSPSPGTLPVLGLRGAAAGGARVWESIGGDLDAGCTRRSSQRISASLLWQIWRRFCLVQQPRPPTPLYTRAVFTSVNPPASNKTNQPRRSALNA